MKLFALTKGQRSKRQPTHSLRRSAYPHQPYVNTVYVLHEIQFFSYDLFVLARVSVSVRLSVSVCLSVSVSVSVSVRWTELC